MYGVDQNLIASTRRPFAHAKVTKKKRQRRTALLLVDGNHLGSTGDRHDPCTDGSQREGSPEQSPSGRRTGTQSG